MQLRTAGAKRRTASESLINNIVNIFAPKAEKAERDAASGTGEERARWYKHPLFRKILFAFFSLLLAMFLWGYVLMNQNPDREKTITGITPKFESGSEADITSRKLTVYGNISDVLKKVDVTIAAPLTEISRITADDITATVSLNNIYSAGTYELEVKAVCNPVGVDAKVISVEPSRISITLDDTVSRSVPIACEFVGRLPEGFWHDQPMLFTTSIPLEGARSDLENVEGAVCYIDLNGLTSTFTRSMELTVLDNNGNKMDNSLFTNVIPSVNVQMRVLPHKHVNILYELTDTEQIPDIYEIQSETLSVSTLDIAAEADVLAGLETIGSVPISVGGIDSAGDYTYTLKLTGIPGGAVILDDVDRNNIQLVVTVGDRYVTKHYYDIPISFTGLAAGLACDYEFTQTDLVLYGPARLINSFVSSDIKISVNLAGRGPGEYDLDLEYKFEDPATFDDMQVSLLHDKVRVIIELLPNFNETNGDGNL